VFNDINKTIKEGQARWEKIDQLYNDLKQKDASFTGDKTVELLLLIVDHLRPMNPTQEQVDEAAREIEDLLRSIKK